jgi:hypothetical protein
VDYGAEWSWDTVVLPLLYSLLQVLVVTTSVSASAATTSAATTTATATTTASSLEGRNTACCSGQNADGLGLDRRNGLVERCYRLTSLRITVI